MNRILVIGDIHGNTDWMNIINKEKHSSVIFLGDYFDNYSNTPYETQIENFKNIIDFKNINKDTVTVLLGNHDWAYMRPSEIYSGTKVSKKFIIGPLIEENLSNGNLEIKKIVGNAVFSHAGISKTWLNDWCDGDIKNLEYKMIRLDSLDFQSGNLYGDSKNQGPLWIRPASLISDFPDDIHCQIVGHTHCLTPYIIVKDNNKIINLDSLPDFYGVVEDNTVLIKDLKGNEINKINIC